MKIYWILALILASTAIVNMIGLVIFWKLPGLLDDIFRNRESLVAGLRPFVENKIWKYRSNPEGTTTAAWTDLEKDKRDSP